MILADTSVWVDHLRRTNRELVRLLTGGAVLIHPFVIGEIALGSLRERTRILESLRALPMADVATDDEVIGLIDRGKLFGRGIGYVDAHLLAAARLAGNAAIWTRDRRLHEVSRQLGLGYESPPS